MVWIHIQRPLLLRQPTCRNAGRMWRRDKTSPPIMVDQRLWFTHTAKAGGREEPCAKKVGALASVWMRSTGSRPMVSTNNGLQRGGDEPHQHNEKHSPRL